jgi:hypothetical protein
MRVSRIETIIGYVGGDVFLGSGADAVVGRD